jgi:hypothetical protein
MPQDQFRPPNQKPKELKPFQEVDIPELWELWAYQGGPFGRMTVYMRNLKTGEIRKCYEISPPGDVM